MRKLFASYTHIEFEGRQMMNPSGVGLGLNIASNLAELLAPKGHHGITVVSVPNEGSIFSFIIENKEERLPVNLRELQDLESDISSSSSSNDSPHKVSEEFPGASQPILFSRFEKNNTSMSMIPLNLVSEPLEGETCSCSKVLVVDDNPFNTMAFETILGSLNVKCDSVYSGSSSIKKVLGRQSGPCGKYCKPYSVVFMDEEMPEMSGTETVKELRKLQSEGMLPKMKIIGCTAHKSKEEIDRFLEAGLDKCIHKPISAGLIRDILRE